MSKRSLALVGLSAVALSGSAVLATSQSGAATSPWAATATHAFPLKGAVLGVESPSRLLNISVALNLRDKAGLVHRLAEVPNPKSKYYDNPMTTQAVRAKYSPTVAQVGAVRDYLLREGFEHISISKDRLLVNGTATVAQAEAAFDTRIADVHIAGQHFYANTAAASVPTSLGSSVASVLGLSDFQMSVPKLKVGPPVTTDADGTAPDAKLGLSIKQLREIYDAGHLRNAHKTSNAIIMAGKPGPVIHNLRYAEKVGHFHKAKIHVVYGVSKFADTKDNPLTGSDEWDLDSQMGTILPGKVKSMYFYDAATYADGDVARGINQFIDQDKAENLSISLGECDLVAYLDGTMLATDDMIAEGGAVGQNVFSSTGDSGAACPIGASTGFPVGPPGVSWPADGEFTTAAGGTDLMVTTAGKKLGENAWSGGGGGVSEEETGGPWTLRATGTSQLYQENNFGGRAVPDVAALAGAPGALVYVSDKPDSKPEAVEGTSVSSPLIMALWTQINNKDHNKLGLAEPQFYHLYNSVNPGTYKNAEGIGVYAPSVNPKPVREFFDITQGDNYAYKAKKGWDQTTGIGSLHAKSLATHLKKNEQKLKKK